MPSVLNVDTIVDAAGTGPVALTKQEAAKVWTNFSGISASIRDSLNSASLTDSATGEFNVNYTNSMGNANYGVQVTSSYGGTDVGGADDSDYVNGIGTLRRTSGSTSTTATKIITGSNVGIATQDHAQSMVLAHGDLA
jgi:hypothetical protein